jgi:PHS family inorganic phosphate transporter-like MFS transporter
MQIYALFMLLGCFTTLCIPETKRRTLEALSGDNSASDTDTGVGKQVSTEDNGVEK